MLPATRQPLAEAFSAPLDANLLESLNSVVEFLHSEGFYAAEVRLGQARKLKALALHWLPVGDAGR